MFLEALLALVDQKKVYCQFACALSSGKLKILVEECFPLLQLS
ncbi:E3 ubiquitin-protein ligase UPL1-like [Iris pallida]|uniref:E3 ubiquitin-protein ligase UPL1-like n=1 Tax=Iris pallida TaxID=29817 RepID=A0AAX6DTH7_IRIPA|nr:E3 ubiquitin-protein ligase UPL1-like [Iris pallida]KAJ6850423.1 E3 ubiquitin-protein ligase UPL1-like [Iris pallida]